ncbi:N-acetyltransferase [Halorubrum persicum]|nr:hypothetical protein [Halorubrum persicum]
MIGTACEELEAGCEEFDPHVDNDRAIAFYEKPGFERTQIIAVCVITDQ